MTDIVDNILCKHWTNELMVQAKLVKYKSEAVEGGTLVEQLSTQARADHHTIREQKDEIEYLKQQQQTDKVG